MATETSPTDRTPQYHASLSDGIQTLGFIFSDQAGKIIENAYRRFPLERTALKTSSGDNKYSDLEPPYYSISQDDWSGGRGSETFEDDVSKYFDASQVQTWKDGEVILGGQQTYWSGIRSAIDNSPGSVTMTQLYGSQQYIAHAFTADASFTAAKLEIPIRKVGTPTAALNAAVYDDTSGSPGSLVTGSTYPVASVTDTLTERARLVLNGTITSGSAYHVVCWGGAADDITNHWEVAAEAGQSGALVSSSGSAWSAGTYGTHYRITDADANFKGIFFEYKRGLYFVSQPVSGSASTLYLNGDRGAADSNSGSAAQLIDGTKNWDTNEFAGCRALITNGPGSGETQNWRTITSNTANALTVSPDWNITHTLDTEYVILGSNKWISKRDLTNYCTGVAVAGEFVYFARGDVDSGGGYVLRYREHTPLPGVWGIASAAETERAEHILSIRNPDDGKFYVYGSTNRHPYYGVAVWMAQVPEQWGSLYNDLGVACLTDNPWDEQVITNVTQGTQGQATKISIGDGFTSGSPVASEVTDPTDITAAKSLGWLAYTSGSVPDGDLWLMYSSSGSVGGTSGSVGFGAMGTAEQWYWKTADISPVRTAARDDTSIISWGVYVATDRGAMDIHLWKGIHLLSDLFEYVQLPGDSRITGMEVYSGDASNPRQNPWIFTESGAWELQTQNGNKLVPLPIGEMAALRSEKTGRVSCVNDVYLYFNLGEEKIQRYYNRNLDDIGPDGGDGLPANRRGTPSAMVSYPGRVFVAIDGGSNYSSVLVMKGDGWHEVYRATRAGARIRALGLQTIPGSTIGRLWINEGADLKWVPVSLNPYDDAGFTYQHEGHLITGYIYLGMRDVLKVFHDLTLFCDNVSSNTQYIQVDYQTDSSSTWTPISSSFNTVPLEEIEIATTPPTGRRIRFRLRFYSTSSTETPRLTASVLKAYAIAPIKYGYSWTTQLTEGVLSKTIDNKIDTTLGQSASVEAAMAVLDGWAAALTPLTLRSVYSPLDNKQVVLDAIPMQPLQNLPDKQIERHLIQVTVNEL